MRPHSRLLQRPPHEDPHRASAPPLYLSATYRLSDPEGSEGGFDYARSGNPTRAELEARLADLEGAARALSFASGLAALRCLLGSLPARPRVVASADLYGGSLRLLGDAVENRDFDLVLGRDEEELEQALRGGADLLLVESPGNPGLGILDLRRLARTARDAGALFAVDASLMSPWLMKPLELGAEVVLHSATKFLGGHADLTAGVLAVANEALGERLARRQNAEGNALAPFDAWLLMRGLDTLGLRVERQQESATEVTRALVGEMRSPHFRVFHPSLASHPGGEVHARQARGPGSLISLKFRSPPQARRFLEALEIFALTVSFGSVRSTASLPAAMSHASVPQDLRRGSRAEAGLLRLSIGLEDPRDLIDALRRADATLRDERSARGSTP
jgi:cystathionine beta-lyase/cystathionine gamma-synthase